MTHGTDTHYKISRLKRRLPEIRGHTMRGFFKKYIQENVDYSYRDFLKLINQDGTVTEEIEFGIDEYLVATSRSKNRTQKN